MIYIDSSHLHEFLKVGKPLSGIQRVTLNCLVGLWRVFGTEQVRALVFFMPEKSYKSCRVEDFLHGGGRHELRLYPCSFSKGDKVLLSEYFWNSAVTAAASRHETFGQAQVFRMIYDVIPLAMPRLFAWSWVRKFRRYVRDAISSADVVLTNSQFSVGDIQKFFPALEFKTPIRIVKLPHEFLGVEDVLAEFAAPHTKQLNQSLKPTGAEALRSLHYVLVVGSLEARKNQQAVMAAWNLLYAKYGEKLPKLVLVGSITSHNWFYKRRMRKGIEANPKILHLKGVNDEGLRWLYRNCLFSLFPSNYEGWGLPIGESLWCGRPVLSGTSTSLPEVGGDLVTYADPNDQPAFIAAIEKMLFDGDYLAQQISKISGAKLRSWNDVITVLAGIIKPV